MVAQGGELIGLIAIANGRSPVKKLRESGVRLAMLSGDNQAIAVRIASVLGIAVALGKSGFFNVEGTITLPTLPCSKMHQKPLLGGDLMRRSG